MTRAIRTMAFVSMMTVTLLPLSGYAAIAMSSPVADVRGSAVDDVCAALLDDGPIRVSDIALPRSSLNAFPTKVRVFIAPGFQMPAGSPVRFRFEENDEHPEASRVSTRKNLNLQP